MTHNVQAPRNAELNALSFLGKKERGVERALLLRPARRSLFLRAQAGLTK